MIVMFPFFSESSFGSNTECFAKMKNDFSLDRLDGTALLSAQVLHVTDLNTRNFSMFDKNKTVVIVPGRILEEHGPCLPSLELLALQLVKELPSLKIQLVGGQAGSFRLRHGTPSSLWNAPARPEPLRPGSIDRNRPLEVTGALICFVIPQKVSPLEVRIMRLRTHSAGGTG